ncbi:MAG: hypothetical protein JWP37_3140 [Mucilaginibacter sp.]|nr:hypothetical protein [Mucilaginibacter sp.]
MLLTAPSKRIHFYFKRPQVLSDLGKRIFSSSNYFGNRAYYKAILNQYTNLYSYINILRGTTDSNSIQTDIDIQPAVLGVGTKNVVSKYGSPIFIFKENKLTIFVYKWKFNGIKTRCEIHFYDNEAFLINYSYNQLNNREKTHILETFASKYLEADSRNTNLTNCKIIDKNNKTVYIDELLQGFKITYIGNKESDWHTSLTNEINAKKEKQTAKIKTAEKHFYSKI